MKIEADGFPESSVNTNENYGITAHSSSILIMEAAHSAETFHSHTSTGKNTVLIILMIIFLDKNYSTRFEALAV
jgi:hypothetical protein